MNLNNYETIYILKPDVTEEKNLSLISEYKMLIRQHGGHNIFIQHRGRRHLSYNISSYYDGIYIQMNYEGNGIIVKKLEKSMRFNSNIIRYLTIKQKNIYTIQI